jgi:Domain of unknown function (DUF4189)
VQNISVDQGEDGDVTVIDENADADPGAETAMGPPCVEETELIAPTEAAPTMLAWSTAEAPALSTQHSWRLAAGIAAGVVVGVAVLAGAVGLTAWSLRPAPQPAVSGSTTLTHMLPPPSRSVTVTAAAPSPAGPQAARPDDDEFVAIAISPHAIRAHSQLGGFGTSGTQEKANQIALSECRGSGNDDCLLVNAGMFHGCVSWAIDSSELNWAGGSGADADAARAAAVSRLGTPVSSTYVQCSDPPGLIRFGTPVAAPSLPSTTTVTVQAAPEPGAVDPGSTDVNDSGLAA